MGPKKSIASKCPRASSSTEFDHNRFVSATAEECFQTSITRRSRIKERGFELDSENSKTEGFYKTIQERGWQLFCRHPKAAAMTVVHEFFTNAVEGPTGHKVFVRGKEVKYDNTTINNLLHLQYNPVGPDDMDVLLNNKANIPMITQAICQSKGTRWTIVRDAHAHFPLNDLHPHMKVWYHFICARLMPTMHLSEVTKERVALLYAILMGKKINVGQWIQHNITHTIRQGSRGIPHPTLLTKLVASHSINIEGAEILQPKVPLNQKVIERIMIHELREEVTGASSSGARAPHLERASQPRATIADLTRAVECHEA